MTRERAAPISLDILRESFYTERIKQAELTDLAATMQRDLQRYFNVHMNLEPKPLDEATFDALYDPTLPTIIVDPEQTFAGSELLGLASHEAETRANILYIPTTTGGATIQTDPTSGKAHLEITSGAFVLPTGQVAYGEFPHPIVADCFETADLSLIEQCETYGVNVFHSSEKMRSFNDKAGLEVLSNNIHTYTPRRIDSDTFLDMTNVDNLVIKPSKHSQGRGVLLTDNDADVDHTKRFYQFLVENNYDPVVEERARSLEITDPTTGERLDWNVRAILSYGELTDMYVRADTWGGPVNMSVSASAISMDDFPEYFKNSNDAWKVMQLLHDSACAVAQENPSSLIGIDLTIDEDMRACLFEINNGNTGGLQTIAKLEQTYDDKLYMTRKVLRNYINHTQPSDRRDEGSYTSIPLNPSFNTIARRAYLGELSDQLANLDVQQVPDTDEERYGAVLALVAIRTSLHWQILDPTREQIAGERLKDDYPLELRRHLGSIYLGSIAASSLKNFVPYILEHNELFRDDAETLHILAGIAADEFELKKVAGIYHQLISRSPDLTRYFYSIIRPQLERRFIPLTKDLNDQSRAEFSQLLEDTLTAYCAYGYKTADRIIGRRIESSKNDTLSPLTRSLRFCMSYAEEQYDDALQYFHEAEDAFEEPDDFYANITDELIPIDLSDLSECSQERLIFATKINVISRDPIATLASAVDFLQDSDMPDEVHTAIAKVLAEQTPLEHTPEEHEELVRVLRRVSAGATGATTHSQEHIEPASDYQKYTLLIDTLFSGDPKTAKRLIRELRTIDALRNGLDYLEDTYLPDEVQYK